MSPPSSLHRIISSHKYEGMNIILYFMILLGPQTSLSVISYGPGTLTPSPCVSCCAGYFLLTWHKLESCEKVEPQLRDCRNQIVPCAYPWSIFLIDNWCGDCSVRCGQWYPWTGDSGSNRRAGWDNHGKQQACSSSLSSTICASDPALASLVNSLEPVSCNRPITLSPPHWLWSWFYHTKKVN